MHVLLNGLPLFGNRLAKDLQHFSPKDKFLFYNTYYNKFDKLKFYLQAPFTDLFISMNGVSDKSGSLEKAFKTGKPIVMQWMGTDILLAHERSKKNALFTKYLDKATHFVDAPWMKNELNNLGLNAILVPFKWTEIRKEVLPYGRVQVATYIPESRSEFYGWKSVLKLATAFPDIPFFVMGANDLHGIIPENVRLLGWIDEKEFKRKLEQSAIFLRLPEHDGYSVSVMEALASGCEVLTTMPFEKGFCVKNDDEIMEAFLACLDKIYKLELYPNKEHITFANENYNREKVMSNYLQQLHGLLK